jgi:hypothetical protein
LEQFNYKNALQDGNFADRSLFSGLVASLPVSVVFVVVLVAAGWRATTP